MIAPRDIRENHVPRSIHACSRIWNRTRPFRANRHCYGLRGEPFARCRSRPMKKEKIEMRKYTHAATVSVTRVIFSSLVGASERVSACVSKSTGRECRSEWLIFHTAVLTGLGGQSVISRKPVVDAMSAHDRHWTRWKTLAKYASSSSSFCKSPFCSTKILFVKRRGKRHFDNGV